MGLKQQKQLAFLATLVAMGQMSANLGGGRSQARYEFRHNRTGLKTHRRRIANESKRRNRGAHYRKFK